MVTEAKVCANPVVLRSLRISTTSPYGAYKPTDDGWQTRGGSPPAPPCLRSTPQSSWQPHSNANASKGSWVLRTHVFKQPNELAAHKPLVVEPQDEPAPSKPIELEVPHAVQYGIKPKRLPLPHTDEKFFSGIDEDVSFIRDGYTAWAMSDPFTALWHHLASNWMCQNPSSARPLKEDFSPQPKYRFDNNAPNRSVQQTRICILSWNLGPRRGREGCY